MPSIVFQGLQPFAQLANISVAQLFALNSSLARLQAAVDTASQGYAGTAGTEYEGPTSAFGIVAGETPGAQGQAFASAVATIVQNWNTFWTAAQGAIDAIDNGSRVTM